MFNNWSLIAYRGDISIAHLLKKNTLRRALLLATNLTFCISRLILLFPAYQLNMLPSSRRLFGKKGALVGVFSRQFFVYVYAMAGFVTDMQMALIKIKSWENLVGLFGVRHVFLNTKITHPGVKMQGKTHSDGDKSVAPWKPVFVYRDIHNNGIQNNSFFRFVIIDVLLV